MYIPDCYNDNYAPEISYQKQEENTHLVKPPFLYILTLWEQSVEITKNGIFDYFRNPVKIMGTSMILCFYQGSVCDSH